MSEYNNALLSYGGGVNTVAMTIRLVNEGWRGPIVFADTFAEHPETLCHIRWMENWLKEHGLAITRVSWKDMPPGEMAELAAKSGAHQKVVNLIGKTLEDYCLTRGIIPLLSVRWCSVTFKRCLILAWQQLNGYDTQLIGISADEPQRIRDDPFVRYPLVEWGWNRQACLDFIKTNDVPIPIKSGCFFCPSGSWRRWLWLWQTHPELYKRAAAMERNASARSRVYATLDPGGQYTLDDLRQRFEAQLPMEGFDSPDLLAYHPCICGL